MFVTHHFAHAHALRHVVIKPGEPLEVSADEAAALVRQGWEIVETKED